MNKAIKTIKNSFIFFSLTVIGGFIFFSVFLIFNSITNKELLSQTVSAFAGAFFAFLLLRLSDFFTGVYKRKVMHFNSLVMLETQLNEIGTIIDSNLYIIPEFINVIASGKIYFNNLRIIPVDKSHFEKLFDIDLMNELFSYQYDIRKINDDIQTLNTAYEDIKNAIIDKKNTPEGNKANTEMIISKLKLFNIFMAKLFDKTLLLLTRIRVQLREDMPLGTALQRYFIRTIKPKEKEINNELNKLKNEIEESRVKSRKENEELLKVFNESSSI